ncbi:MAG: PTS sugar transporter subunit IIB [Spirochaetaceae bacterium]|nr:PTS sugar transporter subunit IIB [Spirochaetaceae bacterium]
MRVKIILACAAGMSTSMLTDRMKKAAAAKSLEAEIAAHPVSELPTEAPGSNIILLGPQVGYMKDKITQEFPDIPVRVVDMRDYGMMNGEKVLQDALDMISP